MLIQFPNTILREDYPRYLPAFYPAVAIVTGLITKKSNSFRVLYNTLMDIIQLSQLYLNYSVD